MTTISRNLRKLREKNTAYQQKDIADLIGIKQSTYSNWESGINDVKGEYIPKLAEILGVEIKDLFEVSTSKIQINQKNSDNKDNSINGLVFILTDEKSIDQIVSVLKNNIQNNKDLISNLSNIALILYVSSKIYIDIQKLSISIWAKPTIAYPSTHNKSEFQ